MSSEYIKALVATREDDNLDIFRGFMIPMMEQNLQNEITTYLDSIGVEESREKTAKREGENSGKVGRKRIITICIIQR